MTPSGDRANPATNNPSTLVMTNIVPQFPGNTQSPRVDLEVYYRDLVDQGKELLIIADGYGNKTAITKGNVIPPQNPWKIVVI